MMTIFRYFRQHRWQRRAITGSMALAAGALAAVLLYPTIRDRMLIRDLADDDLIVHRHARTQLQKLANNNPQTLARLNDALSTDSDGQFAAIASLLRSLDAFHTPDRQGLWLDRLNGIELSRSAAATPDDAPVRWMLLTEILLDGRDNRYVRRALDDAAADKSATVRQLAAILAGRLADDTILAALLADGDAQVAASAAMSIAAAQRNKLAPAVMKMLTEAKDIDRVSAAAWAWAALSPGQAAGQIATMAMATPAQSPLRDRLLHVLARMPAEHAAKPIGDILARDTKEKRYPPPIALLAAGRLKLSGQADSLLYVLDERGSDTGLTEAHLMAALLSADSLALPAWKQADLICRRLWGARHPLLLVTAADVLGRQLNMQGAAAPSRKHCIETLRLAASYIGGPTSQPTGNSAGVTTTALPSAAAAVALWLAGEDPDDKLIRRAAGADTTLPGDYIAWRASRGAAADRAFALGLRMLPPVEAPPGSRVYNDNERSAGAMMLALSARTNEQKRMAADRIARRLEGANGFYTTGALRCALLILGRQNQRDDVSRLLSTSAFPQRRAMTALFAAGEREALDWLLFNKYVSVEDVAMLLTTRGVGEVLSVAAPELPGVDAVAGEDLRLWQVRIMRNYWGVRRTAIHLELRP